MVIITDFEAGVLLISPTLPIWTSGLASGKYVAVHRRGISYRGDLGNGRQCGSHPEMTGEIDKLALLQAGLAYVVRFMKMTRRPL